ncbi:membrane-associated protein, putative [Bodo saltans]|uniref:Membrane-associated protein, putative n=1 Tax=Bodo saltans TaxID=75058 RepID=A0A0S4IKP9_BODSA|nr:membrane-associated protein, putative [Bodo saltans]|eukprot:CUE65819.1 membrane-associated protein, putative [Bodo saltans]
MLPSICCSTTFLVVALLAMGCSIAALWLPLVMAVPDDSTNVDRGHLLVSFLGSHHASSVSAEPTSQHHHHNITTSQRRAFRQQYLSLSNNSLQCPYFNGPCWLGDVPLTHDGDTDDIIRNAGCDHLGSPVDVTSTRFWSIGAATLSMVTVIAAIVHVCKGGDFGRSTSFHKLGASGVAIAHLVCTAIAVGREEPTTSCLETAITNVVGLQSQGYHIIMLSLIMTLIAGCLQLFNALGMLISWWVPCCGAPAGKDSNTNTSFLLDDTREDTLYGGRTADADDLAYRAYRSNIQANNSAAAGTGSGYPGYSD